MMYTVIGARGFVGSRMVRALEARGEPVFLPERNDPRLFERNLGRVIYCAGMTADYAARPFETVEAHVSLLARVLERASFERIVYLSSTRLYDSAESALAKEEDPLVLAPANGRHLYDLSKAFGENLCLNASGGRGGVARLSCVYDWEAGATGFLPALLARAEREKAFMLDSATGFVRDYIHSHDVVRALLAILDSAPGQIVNVASGENVSNAEIAAVLNQAGWNIGFARRNDRQAFAVSDNRRLLSLGVEPRLLRDVLAAWIEGVNRGTR